MADRRSLAIGLGVIAGAAVVTLAVACYTRNRRTSRPDVNQIFESARETIRKLNETLEGLHSAAQGAEEK